MLSVAGILGDRGEETADEGDVVGFLPTQCSCASFFFFHAATRFSFSFTMGLLQRVPFRLDFFSFWGGWGKRTGPAAKRAGRKAGSSSGSLVS